MHLVKPITLAAASLVASVVLLGAASAQDASSCRVLTSWAGWGQDGTATFDVGAGKTCLLGASTFGRFVSSKVAQRPAHGTVRQLSVSSWKYTANPGFTGTDSFVIAGTGHDPSQREAKRSQITLSVNVR
jgi:hypothetical protein